MGKFFSSSDMSRLKAIAVEEILELDERMGKALETIDKSPDDEAAWKELLIIFHTIGGSAGLTGLKIISKLGVETESAVKKMIAAGPTADSAAAVRTARAKLHELMKDPK